jgi:hypothetical protein
MELRSVSPRAINRVSLNGGFQLVFYQIAGLGGTAPVDYSIDPSINTLQQFSFCRERWQNENC